MIRSTLLAAVLLLPNVAVPALDAAPRRSSVQPSSPSQLTWQIVALPRGGRGRSQVFETVLGSESRADARVAYLQVLYPNYYFAYRLAR